MATRPPLSGIVFDEGLFGPLMGPVIGAGSSRIVVDYQGVPDLVIKVSYRPAPVSNWAEWNLWLQIQNEAVLASAFGACQAISASGKYLVMERLDNLNPQQVALRRCPPWITDRKPPAFGVNAKGEVKLRDYNHQSYGSFLSQLPLQACA